MHTPESRNKISAALKDKPKSASHKATIAAAMRGTQRLREFCEQNMLSYSAFRRAHAVGSGCPISRGASAGWIVFAVKRLKTQD